MGCIYIQSWGVTAFFSHCWHLTLLNMHNQTAGTVGCKGHGRRSDPLVPGTHWVLRQFLSCKNFWEGDGERERELARMLANWATKQIELAEAQSSNTNLIWADLAWFHSSPPRAQVLPQQPQFHVGPGCLWTRQPFCNNGNCIWWDVPGQKRFDDPRLDCSWLQNVAWLTYYRRKFRSETSDNMDSWKAEVKRVRREKIRRKKMQMREKVGKSRNTVFFQWFGAPEGRKVGSLKRRVRGEMKNCTPLWREAHFQVKMYKTHSRTTFGSWDVEKVHAVVARSTFRSQKC